MRSQQTRRRYLLGAGLTALSGLAGCSEELTTASNDDTESGTETPDSSADESATTVPDWAQWIPASPVTSGSANGLALDIQRARSEYPQSAYEEFDISQIAEVYGIDQSDMDYFCGRTPPVGDGVWVLTGSFEPSDVLSTLGVDESETDAYRGYDIVEDIAIGPEALLVNDSRRTLDTRFGGSAGLDDASQDWRALLSAVGDGTLTGVETGFFTDASLSFSMLASGIEVNASETGDGAVLVAHLLFPSESRAEEVLANYEQEIRTAATDENESLESFEQRGQRLVLTLERPSFDLGGAFSGGTRL